MKNVVLSFLLFLSASVTYAYDGIAFYDIEEYRDFNTWIRQNPLKALGTPVKRILDSLVQSQKDNLGMSVVQFNDGEYGFITYEFDIDEQMTIPLDTITLSETDFRIDVDLEERQVILQDQSHHQLLLVFPIAHGGLSAAFKHITTPRFKNAYLNKSTIISERWKPSYFKGKPFLRVMTDKKVNKGWTGIGFHIKMNSSLKRSPDSHGCIRLRGWDLQTMHDLIKYGPKQYTPLDIHLRYDRPYTLHPHTLYNDSFKKEKNYGSSNYPETRRGKDGLIIYETIYETPVPYIDQMED